MALLELQHLTAGYGDRTILQDLDLEVERGEFLSLLGPSGCGKTTTLRLIAGFSAPENGRVLFDGKDYTKRPLHRRNFGFVFQSYALFPHMTIAANVAFGLKMRRMAPDLIRKEVDAMLDTVDLSGLGDRYPSQLSGGQRQRAALARALVIRPDLLLLDEPLSNLDARLRVKMRGEIRSLQKRFGLTAVYVTHDQEECFAISDRVAVMNRGVIEQVDAPAAIYHHPVTEFTARFVGFENFLDLKRERDGGLRACDGTLLEAAGTGGQPEYRACIRPEDIRMAPAGTDLSNRLDGRILDAAFLGKYCQYHVKTPAATLTVSAVQDCGYQPGSSVSLQLPPDKLLLLNSHNSTERKTP